MENERRRLEIDTLTLVAISIVAWAMVIVLHEFVGHAVVALSMGIPVKLVTTSFVDIQQNQVRSFTQSQIISAGGTFLNLLTGAIALAFLQFRKSASNPLRYFLWLYTTMSLVVVCGYLISATAIGAGDWIQVIRELKPRNLFLAIIILSGVLIALPAYALPLRSWMPKMKGDRLVLLKVTVIPVVTLIITQTLSVLRSPLTYEPSEVNPLLASAFIYIQFVVWSILVNVIPIPRSSNPIESIRLGRSVWWIVAGIIVLLPFVLILGFGVGPFG